MNIGVTGRNGEDRVAAFLIKNGFSIVKRNFQCRFGEIDIIAENDEYIVFAEVKTRKAGSMITPAQSVDLKKQKKIRITAEKFLSNFETQLQPRFDVAEVTVSINADGTEKYELNYIVNAF